MTTREGGTGLGLPIVKPRSSRSTAAAWSWLDNPLDAAGRSHVDPEDEARHRRSGRRSGRKNLAGQVHER